MSEKNSENDFNKFQGELSGSRSGMSSGTIAGEMAKRDKRTLEQKKEKNRELLLSQAEQAHFDLMHLIDQRLDAIHEAMQKNRDEWDVRANRLNDIDDLLQEVKDGGELDLARANTLITGAGKTISDNATSADYYRILIEIKTDDLERIETLDESFVKLEEGENFYRKIQEQANTIHNDQRLNEQDRLAAYARLNAEAGKANFVEAALGIENQNQKIEMADTVKTDHTHNIQNSANKISDMKLNF
ncbi:hypothetical protein [Tenacibaculum agarivorans]|uniref:hypothetical protein n=1 Tax=Tenacibaculum agarivorans TaxID=1908389 RepID=UPI00094B8191|nr:hypothetical protein [Tenacibaculum agarivorans]